VKLFDVARMPPHVPGLRIGLFGGSFDPPHEGHRAVSLLAMRRLGLDTVWWLVSPGNPLKDTSHLPSLEQRREAARKLARHPRIVATAIEAAIGTRYSVDTISYLKKRCPGVHFVWLMGADNFVNFHHWKNWREIAKLVPIAIIDRPGSTLKAMHSPAANALGRYRLDESDAPILAMASPPAFVFLHGPRSSLSSTALRAGKAQSTGA
jgi:nicotinate-nucleotide adenylyltransferase